MILAYLNSKCYTKSDMKKLNEYERHAYVYSAWTALMVPFILTVWVIWNRLPVMLDALHTILRGLSIIVSSAVIYAAIGFYIRELFRSTSKLIFQFPVFKEDETKMPTTEFLMWKNKLISRSQIEQVHTKLWTQYNYMMFDEQKEVADEFEERRNIVGAVGIMREATRGNKMLLQCNYRYGYQRNMLGGLVWSFLLVLAFMIINFVCAFPYALGCLIALALILLQGFMAFYFMKYAARNYARILIMTFISK